MQLVRVTSVLFDYSCIVALVSMVQKLLVFKKSTFTGLSPASYRHWVLSLFVGECRGIFLYASDRHLVYVLWGVLPYISYLVL